MLNTIFPPPPPHTCFRLFLAEICKDRVKPYNQGVLRKPGVPDAGLGIDQQRQESTVCSWHRGRWQRGCAGVPGSAGAGTGFLASSEAVGLLSLFTAPFHSNTNRNSRVFPSSHPGQSVCSSAWIIAADNTVSS